MYVGTGSSKLNIFFNFEKMYNDFIFASNELNSAKEIWQQICHQNRVST